MSRHALFASMLIVTLGFSAACSDDEHGPSDAGTSEKDSGNPPNGKDASPVEDAAAQDAAAPMLAGEGALCAKTSECGEGLHCVETTDGNVSIGICARFCTTGEECEAGELCYAYTANPSDAHCVNLIAEQYGVCGVGQTSRCDGHTCLYFPKATTGLCVDLCQLASNGADGGMDDAGTPSIECATGQTCIAGVVDSPMQGLCGLVVAAGAKCGVQAGRFCGDGYGCVPDKRGDNTGPRHCRADCTTDGKCPQGTACRGVVGQSAFCY